MTPEAVTICRRTAFYTVKAARSDAKLFVTLPQLFTGKGVRGGLIRGQKYETCMLVRSLKDRGLIRGQGYETCMLVRSLEDPGTDPRTGR